VGRNWLRSRERGQFFAGEKVISRNRSRAAALTIRIRPPHAPMPPPGSVLRPPLPHVPPCGRGFIF
jgi:hypothetical protein